LGINPKDKNKILNRAELREIGINKGLSTPSAVYKAAAISSYARVLINEYKNIPDNPALWAILIQLFDPNLYPITW